MSASFYLNSLMIRGVFCMPGITFEFIVTSWKNQLTGIVLKVNDNDPVIIEQNCIRTKTPILLIEWVANKDAVEIMFLEHGIHDLYYTTKLLVFVSFGLLV